MEHLVEATSFGNQPWSFGALRLRVEGHCVGHYVRVEPDDPASEVSDASDLDELAGPGLPFR